MFSGNFLAVQWLGLRAFTAESPCKKHVFWLKLMLFFPNTSVNCLLCDRHGMCGNRVVN